MGRCAQSWDSVGGHLRHAAPEAVSGELCVGPDPESWCCSVLLYILVVAQIKDLSPPRPPSRQSGQQLYQASRL